jgi:ribose 5-phosphate isomerase B
MKVALGADHRGFALKEKLKAYLERRGHAVADKGTYSTERADYPDYAFAVARAVAGGRAARGILVCSTGLGMTMAANRVRGIRAALCDSVRLARMAREHNDSNVLCLGAGVVGWPLVRRIVDVWLRTAFAGGRHRRRVLILDRRPNRP